MKLFNYLAIVLCLFLTNTVSATPTRDYQAFLVQMEHIAHWSQEQHDLFSQKSWQYWMSVKSEVNDAPTKYSSLISQYHQLQSKHLRPYAVDVNRFKSSIEQFERFDDRNSPVKNATLFVGSSSIVYWQTAKSFPQFAVINRGFGGASIAEIEHFYRQVIKRHNPKNVVLYSDIDIENGVSPTQSVANHTRLIKHIEQDFPQANILILAMKPTLVDFILGKNIRANKAIANRLLGKFSAQRKQRHYIDITKVMYNPNQQLNGELFLDDGMHLNDKGYQAWQPLIVETLKDLGATTH